MAAVRLGPETSPFDAEAGMAPGIFVSGPQEDWNVMGTLVNVEIQAKPDHVQDVIGLLKQLLPETRAYEGCQEVTVYLNDDGRTFMYFETWDSKSHYERYLAWREETGVLAELVALLEGPPRIRYFEAVAA